MAEITDLVDWGMMDNYEQESDNSAAAEVPSTEADTLPPLKREKPILLLDTHFQTSTAETEASGESNPAGASPMAVAHSSHSSSPIAHLSKLQSRHPSGCQFYVHSQKILRLQNAMSHP